MLQLTTWKNWWLNWWVMTNQDFGRLMQSCVNWYCACLCALCTLECVSIWKYWRVDAWMYECDLNDHINCIWQVTRLKKTKHVRLEADWQRSTNTRQTSLELMLLWINRAIGGMKPGTRWRLMPLGKPALCWSKIWEPPFVNGRRVFFPRHAFAVVLCFCFSLWKIPNFCLDRPFGFSVHREYIPFFCALNFCLHRPFGFSVHRGALCCLSRLIRFSA